LHYLKDSAKEKSAEILSALPAGGEFSAEKEYTA